jgi:hypothetical protein
VTFDDDGEKGRVINIELDDMDITGRVVVASLPGVSD